jgi:hypothetical protein
MALQETSWRTLWCPNPEGMGADYQFAEGIMFKWNGSYWVSCRSIARDYNDAGQSAANAVAFGYSLCGTATYELEGHYEVAWAFEWHPHWNYTPGTVIY